MKTIKGKTIFKSESFKAGMASLGWASVVLLLTTFVFFIAIGESMTEGKGIVGFMVYFLITYYIVLAVSCFLIVKKNPRSFWFVPLVCNALTIVAAITDSSFWKDTKLTFVFCSALVLSIIASIIGALVGRRRTIPK
jgi:hypothetical protein